MPSCSVVSRALYTASLISRTAMGGFSAMRRARRSASSRQASVGTTRLTRPMRYASSAVIGSPVSKISRARALPTRRVRRCVPPAPGMTPRFTSGWPKRAFSPAMIRSQAMASSHPPPRAYPLTAAMMGLVIQRMRSHTRNWLRRFISTTPASAISVMSAPAAKARSLPVSTMQRTASSRSRRSRASTSSSTSARLRALSTSGRLRRMRATPSERSTSRYWYARSIARPQASTTSPIIMYTSLPAKPIRSLAAAFPSGDVIAASNAARSAKTISAIR